MPSARRVKVFHVEPGNATFDRAVGWHWTAQGTNWRTIATSERAYATHGKARKAARRRYPEAEIVVERERVP